MDNINTLLFRCSSLGHLMVKDKAGKGLGEMAKTHLSDNFVSFMYGRREEITSKFLDKGNSREEDAITLVSRISKKFFKKNSTRLFNDYITGEPDIFIGDSICEAEETIDTKTSWSAHTFFRSKLKLNPLYEWQGHGYMWLTGAHQHTVAFCLVNGTDQAIIDEKRRLAWSYGPDPDLNPDYVRQCKQIEINHIFDLFAFKEEYPHFDFHNDLSEWRYDIPMNERLHTFTIQRSENKIEQIKEHVAIGRKWIENNLLTIK